MQETQVAQTQWIRAAGEPMPLDELRAWDWRAELRRQERGMTWLARHTDRAAVTVYRYSDGTLTPPEAWLREVAQLLGVERAA